MRFLQDPRPGKGVPQLSHLQGFRISFSILLLILAKPGGLRTYCAWMLLPCPSSGRAGCFKSWAVFLYCWGHQQQLLACNMSSSMVIRALS